MMGLSNTEDALWYRLAPSDQTLKHLDAVFDIYDNLFEEEEKDIFNYQNHIRSEQLHFHKETESYTAYFILTEQVVHLILRKTKEWEPLAERIRELFRFK